MPQRNSIATYSYEQHDYIVIIFFLGAVIESSSIHSNPDNNDSSTNHDQINRFHFIYLPYIYYVDDTHESFTRQICFYPTRNGTGKEYQLNCFKKLNITDFQNGLEFCYSK
jgi:hypothetical protein